MALVFYFLTFWFCKSSYEEERRQTDEGDKPKETDALNAELLSTESALWSMHQLQLSKHEKSWAKFINNCIIRSQALSFRSHPTTLEKYENAALFLRLGLPSTLIWNENAFRPEEIESAGYSFQCKIKHLKTELFENDNVTIIGMWFSCPSFPQTQVQNDQWLLLFKNFRTSV